MTESKVAKVSEESTSEEESSHTSRCLRLQYSSPHFKGCSSTLDGNDEDSQCSVVLYLHEPEWESGSEAESGASWDGKSRLEEWLLNFEW